MDAPALRVAGASKTYERSDAPALLPTSFDVAPGEFVSLVGPSGCGKSTLLGMIAGLLTPDSGTVEALGKPVTGPGDGRAIVFQDAALFPWLTVFHNVEYGLRAHGVPKAERRERVEDALRLVHLDHVAGKHPYELSGGMRQRASIARALVMEPEILLMDEPFSALDAKVRKELRAWLRNLHDEMHVTTVIVTHDQEEAMEVADRIVVMNLGKIEQIGTPAEIYDQPASPFVMSFVGAVNVLPSHSPLAGALQKPAEDSSPAAQLFIRPHDLELHPTSREGSVPAILHRLTHMGRDIQAELRLSSGEVVVAQLPRERIDYRQLKAGDQLHITSRETRTFVPDYMI